MTTRVEHWGTSVVANYGDLLYPLVLERVLGRTIPDLELSFADPVGGRAPMGLDHRARRALRHHEPEFWGQVAAVDALVIGGGDLLHHGTSVVTIDDSTARIENWGFVESGLLGEVRPVAWSGLGVPFEVPPELAPALRAACRPVALLTVRDEGSRRRLEAAGVDVDVQVVPDTAFLIEDVVSAADRQAALDSLRQRGQLPPSGACLVAHVSFASPGALAEVAGTLPRASIDAHPDLQVVLLAIGSTHGDAASLRSVAEQLDRPSWLVSAPTVVEVTAIVGAATAVVSTSFHAALVASVYGVPSVSFGHSGHRPAKLVDLVRELEREPCLLDHPSAIPTALDAVLSGSAPVSAPAVERLKRGAGAHLSRVAEVVTRPIPDGVDLAERGAAHRHAVEQLAATEAALDRARQELEILGEHHERAVQRARVLEVAYWRERDRT